MKNIVKFVLLSSIIIFIIIPTSSHAFLIDNPDLSLITVTGDAEVLVVPDEVILTFGVETWNQDLSMAKIENDQKIQKIISYAKKQDIQEKDIQTDHISIEPRYGDQWEHRKFIGYFVRKSIVIKLKDTSKFEEVLSGVLQEGANYVHGIQFQTSELRKHRDEARSLAIKAAHEKAVSLAEELGQKVGRPHKIQEGPVNWWSGYGSGWGGFHKGFAAQNVIQNASSTSEGGSAVALGQIKINANVTVSFELEDIKK